MGGVFAPRPSSGPHKLRECLPLMLIVRNRLKYALNCRETTMVLMGRFIKVDGKVRTDPCYPAGFMDVISIEKTKELYRLLFNVKGRFSLHRITPDESKFKLCKVKKSQLGPKGVPYIVTHDGRTIRYPHPDVKINDTVKVNIEDGKILERIPFGVGNLVMVTAGRNLGRVGILKNVEKHPGSHTIVYVEDLAHKSFATRLENLFIIGHGAKSEVTLPRGGGIKLSVLEDKKQKLARKAKKNQ